MVDVAILTERLLALRARASATRRALADRDSFLRDVARQESAAFNFMLAVQAGLDAAAHVLSDGDYGLPTSARAHFDLLANARVIDAGLASRPAEAAAVRNLIAHAYDGLSQARFYDEVPGGLDALDQLATDLARTLGAP